MFSSYGQAAPQRFTSIKQLETFVRSQLYDSGLPQFMVDQVFPIAMKRVLAIAVTQEKPLKGYGAYGSWLSDRLGFDRVVATVSHTVEQVKKVVPKVIADPVSSILKPIGDTVVHVGGEIGRLGQQAKESIEDLYNENFGPKRDSRIPTNDELLKAGDIDGNGFILTNKINRLLPMGVSINFIAQNQEMMGTAQWHELNYQVNHLLPWLINNNWITFDKKAQRWNMPFRSNVGQMNGTGRVGTGDFNIDIYGWHNLNDEAMLGTLTTFLPTFSYTPQMKTDLQEKINSLAESVQRKSGREWNANATRIAAAVIAIVVVAVFVPTIVTGVMSAVSAGLKVAGVKGEWTPDDILTKQLVDGTSGAVFPKSVELPDTSANLDVVLQNIKLNPTLSPQQKNNAAIVINKNKEVQTKKKSKALAIAAVVGTGLLIL